MDIARSGSQPSAKGSADYFTGTRMFSASLSCRAQVVTNTASGRTSRSAAAVPAASCKSATIWIDALATLSGLPRRELCRTADRLPPRSH